MADAKSWRQIRGQRPLSESRVATYRRLMEAQELIAAELARGGVDTARLASALPEQEAPEPELSDAGLSEQALYLSLLARYVTALGGRLELRAVFPEATVRLPDADA